MMTIEYFQEMFGPENAKVLDYHSGNIAQEFVCNGLEAMHVCNQTRTMQFPFTNKNDGFLYDEDIVIMEAYNQGVLYNSSDRVQRHQATVVLRKYWDETVVRRESLPQTCSTPSQTEWLWNRSVYMEEYIMPHILFNVKEELIESPRNSVTWTL